MIPIIKGNEPKALTEAKRDIQKHPGCLIRLFVATWRA